MSDDQRQRLRIDGRAKLPTTAFRLENRLYRAYYLEELDDSGEIDVETLRFPDLSCNWSRFSLPEDVRIRERGRETDGCYSVSVITARWKSIATPVHDPIDSRPFENYSHVEVRELREDEGIYDAPPRNRKFRGKKHKIRRKEYRRNFVQNLRIEIHASA